MGGSHFRERVVHMGVHKGGGSQWVHEKGGGGVHRGGHTKGVHVNHGNPPGYGPGQCTVYSQTIPQRGSWP